MTMTRQIKIAYWVDHNLELYTNRGFASVIEAKQYLLDHGIDEAAQEHIRFILAA